MELSKYNPRNALKMNESIHFFHYENWASCLCTFIRRYTMKEYKIKLLINTFTIHNTYVLYIVDWFMAKSSHLKKAILYVISYIMMTITYIQFYFQFIRKIYPYHNSNYNNKCTNCIIIEIICIIEWYWREFIAQQYKKWNSSKTESHRSYHIFSLQSNTKFSRRQKYSKLLEIYIFLATFFDIIHTTFSVLQKQ